MMMKPLAPLVLLFAALPLAACGKAEEPLAETESSSVTEKVVDVDGTAPETEKTVVFKADSTTGEVGIDLPGGTGATLRLPPDVVEKIGAESKTDIDGVGLYPGARVTEIAATSREKAGAKASTATIRFTAPASPTAVAEWYVAAFRDKGHSATRTGSHVEGKTKEGSRFTVDLAPQGDDTAGTLVVTDPATG